MSHGVYRLFDTEGTLLYVGVSERPCVRFGQHRATQPWWPQVDAPRTQIFWFEDRDDAERVEAALIREEQPLHNSPAWRAKGRVTLTDADRAELRAAADLMRAAEARRAEVRREVVDVVLRSSYRKVSKATGIAVSTLQRWVKEAE